MLIIRSHGPGVNNSSGSGKIADIVWIGQGGFLFSLPSGKRLVVDPYLSNSVEKREGLTRLTDIVISPSEVKADLVLCTHDHLDHTDPETLPELARWPDSVFVGPPSSCEHMRQLGVAENRIVEIHRGECREFTDVQITATYAEHTPDSVGYMLDFSPMKVYISGDTLYSEKLEEIKDLRPDIMFICINGRWGNMNAEEAAKIAVKIGPTLVIPMHYGLFKENTADPMQFVKALEQFERHPDSFIMEQGVSYELLHTPNR